MNKLRTAATVAALGLLATTAASAREVPQSPAQRCKIVHRVVRGKKKRVRVCAKPKSPPLAGRVSATIPMPGNANIEGVAASDTAIWVTSDDRRLFRVDPASNKVVAAISLPASEWPEANVAVGDDAVWVTVASPSTIGQSQLDSLLRIDPQTNQVVARIHVGHSPSGIAITPDSVWTANHRSEWDAQASDATGTYDISRVSVASNSEIARPVVETRPKGSDAHAYWCCGPAEITFAAGSIWLTDPQPQGAGNGLVIRVDPATNAMIARISFNNSKAQGCGDIVGDDTAVWLTSGCDNPYVARLDPHTDTIVATINAGRATNEIALGFGSVWVTSYDGLSRIDPQTNAIAGQTDLLAASGVASGAGSVWVGDGHRLLRLTPS
jgi:YVTN family beta-propeller protein